MNITRSHLLSHYFKRVEESKESGGEWKRVEESELEDIFGRKSETGCDAKVPANVIVMSCTPLRRKTAQLLHIKLVQDSQRGRRDETEKLPRDATRFSYKMEMRKGNLCHFLSSLLLLES